MSRFNLALVLAFLLGLIACGGSDSTASVSGTPATSSSEDTRVTSSVAATSTGDGQTVSVVVSGLSGHVGDDLAGVLYDEDQLIDLDLDPVGGFWSVVATDDFTTTEVLRELGPLGEGRFPFVSDEALIVEPGTYTLVLWVDDRLNPVHERVPMNADGRGLFGCQVVLDVTDDAPTEIVVPANVHPDGWNINCSTGETVPGTGVAEPSTSVLPGPESWNPILATTVAKTAPPAATCPVGSAPNVAGSIDQQRPHRGWVGNLAAAFDRHTGRITYVDRIGETWTFDVCANRWDQMNPNGFPAHETVLFDSAGQPSGALGALVYDVDSDVTVALGHEHVSVYDANTNTWTQQDNDTVGIGDGLIVPTGAAYDSASGLILTTHRSSSGSWDLWAYDVDTNTWSMIGTIPGDIEQLDFLGYSQTIDRFIIVGFVEREPATVLLDPRTGETTIVSTDTPIVDLGWPGAVYGQADGTVFVSDFDGGFALCRFDTTSLTWTCEKAPVTVPSKYYLFAAAVGDSINGRLVLINGIYFDWWPSAADDVWAYDLDIGEWTEILAPASVRPTGSAAVGPESVPPASTETDASLDLSITVTVSAEGSVNVAFDDDDWRRTIAAMDTGERLVVVRASILPIEQLDDSSQWAWNQAMGEAWLIGGAGTDGGDIMTESDHGDAPEDVPATFASGTYRLLFEGWVPSGPMLFGCEAELPVVEGQESVLIVPGLPPYSGSGIWWSAYADLRFPACPT